MQLLDSKSLLAKLMATENLTVEQRNVPTAMFNVKTRVLTVPVLGDNISNELYDLFMGHETGHALYTPYDEMLDAVETGIVPPSILNVVEDSRIERKIKYKYPGLKIQFVKAYRDLFERDFFATQGEDVNSYNLIDRINLYCKVGAHLNIKFTDDELVFLNDVETTESYADVIDVATRITEYMRAQAEKKAEEEKIIKKKMLVKSKRSSKNGNVKTTTIHNDLPEVDLDEDEDISLDDLTDEEQEEFDNLENGDVEIDDTEIEESLKSFTDEAYKENEEKLFAESPNEYRYVNIPYMDPNKVVFDYKDLWKLYKKDGYSIDSKTLNSVRIESNKVVSYLVKEFELRKNADQMKRASISKTGELNMSKIFSYQFSEDIFRKITVVPGGKSHGLIMFIDWSGSMTEHIKNTTKQLLNLVMFCKKVNIPYEVYAFVEDTIQDKKYRPNFKVNDAVFEPYGCMNLLSSRMSTSDFNYAAAALCHMSGMDGGQSYHRCPTWMQMNGTPLNQAIISAMELVPKFQKDSRVQIVNTVILTDGESNNLRGFQTDDGFPKNFQYYRSKLVLTDPITKYQETVDVSKQNRSTLITNALIKILKHRTKCNIVGFYVISGREFSKKVYQFYPNNSELQDKMREEFRKESSIVLTTEGFDEYYILRSNGLSIDDDDNLKIDSSMTTRGLVSAFTKYTSNRIMNRVVLNRFIKLIA